MRLMCATHNIIDNYSEFIKQDYYSITESLDEDDVVIDFYDYEIENENRQYIALPHEAFSGRCYHRNRLNLIDKTIDWKSLICRK